MINTRWTRWVFLAPLVILATGMANLCSVDAAPLPNKGPVAHAGNPQVMCIGERVSVKAKSFSRYTILDNIAKACRLKIHSTSAEQTSTLISVDISNVVLSDTLNELLRGCDYLVVYNESPENTGFFTSITQAEPMINTNAGITEAVTVVAGAGSEPLPIKDKRQERADFICFQIKMLNARIESGASDRVFQQAIKTTPPEFVQDDRKRLADYQKKLASLTQNQD